MVAVCEHDGQNSILRVALISYVIWNIRRGVQSAILVKSVSI